MKSKSTIAFLSTFKWNSKLLHREHMLAKEFAKLGFEVIYVEKEYLNPFKFLVSSPVNKENVKVVTFFSLPYLRGYFNFVYQLNDWLLSNQLRSITKKKDDVIMFASTPYWANAMKSAKREQDKIVYDMSDNVIAFAKNPKWAKQLTKYEEIMLQVADNVFVTNKNLLEKVKGNKKAYFVENGVDLDSFGISEPVITSSKPVAGFVGGIYDWVDLDLIKKSAQAYPDVLFALVGPTNRHVELNDILKQSNVKYYGDKSWQEIGNYFASFNVGLVPYVSEREYPRLKTVNSNKIYQYAFFGYPIVSTDFGQVRELKEIVDVSENDEKFIANIGKALALKDEKKAKLLKEYAANSSWEKRAKEIVKALGLDE